MHDSAYRIGELVMRTYSDLPNAKILEVGSLNVNGCLRDAAAPTTKYTGLDLEEGPSVDHVISPGTDFPVEDDSFDLVMASSVFEHDSRFWDTFMRMCRAARPGGHIYVNAPSNGTVHRYPMDCWRFYPDAGLALAEYARSQGLEIDLIESFIGNRHSDVWNDFTAIFRKGPSDEPMNTAFVYHRYPSLNARTWQSRAVYNESDSTEDMRLIEELRARCESLSNPTEDSTAQLNEAREALVAEQGQRTALSEELSRLSAAFTEVQQNGTRAHADNQHLANQIAHLESNLRQRQEEIEQAWTRADDLTNERDELRYRLQELEGMQERLQSRILEADGWVFDLAGERRILESRLAAVQSQLEEARRSVSRIEAVSEFKEQQLHEHRSINRRVLAGVARLQGLETEPNVLKTQTERLRHEWREEEHPLTDLAEFLHEMAEAVQETNARTPDVANSSQNEMITALLEHKASLHCDVEMLVRRLEEREGVARQAQEQIAVLNQNLTSLRSDALEYHSKAASALEQLSILQAENKQQVRALRAAEERAARKDRQLEWMQRLYRMLESCNVGLKGFLPPVMRRRRASLILQHSNHFDGEAYLAKYPDVAEAGMDPLHHYILHGMSEGRFIEASPQS